MSKGREKKIAHQVLCFYCNKNFDRDKEEYVQIRSRRYAHAACYLREREKKQDKTPPLEIIDPLDKVECAYCHQQMSKSKDDVIKISERKYAHKHCAEIESKRELTDKEKLERYIMQMFNTDYVPPRIRKQIDKYIAEFNYTYSGILKSLQYFYEVKNGDITKAGESIGIVPYVYQRAYEYYYNIWLAHQKNETKTIEVYQPKVIEVVIEKPKRKIKKRKLFSFLDEEKE